MYSCGTSERLVAHIGHRSGWIADIFVETALPWGFKAQAAVGLQVEHALFGLRWRPRLDTCARRWFRSQRHMPWAAPRCSCPFRYFSKNGSRMWARKKSAVFWAKSALPSLWPSSRHHPPCTHGPSTSRFTVSGFRSPMALIERERPLQVFGVKPSAYRKHRTVDVLHPRRQVALLPMAVKGGVRHLLIPQRITALQVLASPGYPGCPPSGRSHSRCWCRT